MPPVVITRAVVGRRVGCGGQVVDEQLQQPGGLTLGGAVGERRVVEDLAGDLPELVGGGDGLVGG